MLCIPNIRLLLLFNIIPWNWMAFATQSKHALYRRMNLDANDWTQFVFKTINFEVSTKIECGSACSFHGDVCNMFIHMNTYCHIGNYDNGGQNILTELSGDHPLFLDLGKFIVYFYA